MADLSSRITFARGDVVSRKYEVESHLGTGLFGATYLGRHIASGRHIAIKFLHPEIVQQPGDRQRFQQAFARAKQIKHPGLTRLGEVSEHNGVLYYTEEYFKSQSLRQVIDEYVNAGQAFTLQESCAVVIKVLEALQAGHESGLVHRNLKPENVLVHTQRTGPAGSRIVRQFKITDMGMCDMLDPAEIIEGFENRSDFPYLAPELGGYEQPGTSQSDIYSVGVVFYELLCGQTPMGTFLSPTQLRDDLPDHIDHVVELALSPNPEDRYPAAVDMIRDIQRSFDPGMQAQSAPTSYRTVLIALAVAVVAVAMVGGYRVVGDEPDPLEEARKKDQVLRDQVAKNNPLPSEVEIKAMIAQQPDMVYVPGGTYIRGRLHAEDASLAHTSEPVARIIDVNPFFIDRFEFPNLKTQAPTGQVSWTDADETCKKFGKRLCTEVEWEKSCKGPNNFIYGYGDTWDPAMCGENMEESYSLGSRADCVSSYGVYDQSGGFREWTQDARPGKNDRKIVKGGHRGNSERGTRCAYYVDESMGYADSTLSFRCCLDAQ